MRYSIPVKFIAIALTAVALLMGVASGFGIVKVAEQGLYTDGFESWIDNRLQWQAQALVEDLTERYAVKKLTNCEDELLEELRILGHSNIYSIKFAVLESNGKLSVLLKAAQTPVTAAQMQVKVTETGLPVIIVSDGRVLSENLHALGKDEKWLYRKLAAHGLTSPKQTFLLTADQSGDTYCVPKEEKQ